jgi:hypothetical protein
MIGILERFLNFVTPWETGITRLEDDGAGRLKICFESTFKIRGFHIKVKFGFLKLA